MSAIYKDSYTIQQKSSAINFYNHRVKIRIGRKGACKFLVPQIEFFITKVWVPTICRNCCTIHNW